MIDTNEINFNKIKILIKKLKYFMEELHKK